MSTQRFPLVRRSLLPLWFLLWTMAWVSFHVASGAVGLDARIYAEAARTWLEGGNPWSASVIGIYFAAPPPTLVPFVPFAFLPHWVTAAAWVIGSVGAGVWLVRRLKLPMWWLLFPPLSSGALSGNPDVILTACLVAGGPLADTLAVFLKIYAVGPLVGERRWRSLIAAGVGLAASLPLLPWGRYLAEFGTISDTLREQATGLSAWGSVPLLALAVPSLLVLGWRRAGWFGVPAIWPNTQAHYSTIALPALIEFNGVPFYLAAALFALPYTGGPVLATGVLALSVLLDWHRRRGSSATTGRVAGAA